MILNLINKQEYRVLTFSISSIVLVFTISYGVRVASTLHVYYHHDFLYYLFVLNFMIFWSVLYDFITSLSKNFITDFIEWMGKNVTAFYVIQWLLIGNIATGLYKTQNSIQIIIWFVAIVILSSLITLLWNEVSKRKLR